MFTGEPALKNASCWQSAAAYQCISTLCTLSMPPFGLLASPPTQNSNEKSLVASRSLQHRRFSSESKKTFYSLYIYVYLILRGKEHPHVREFQDSLRFWIPRRGFRIPGTGFQPLSVELGFCIPIFGGFRIP